ncbi:MAG: hypothetical protein HUJ68_12000 [Clostridia bacterium]|nr:hypothetical protein [Clostridia bacterium]
MIITTAIDGKPVKSEIKEMIGFSTDDKPTNVGDGSTFLEVDTSEVFIYLEGTWHRL